MKAAWECDLCGLGCGKHPLLQHVGDTTRYFCCLGCMNVYLILSESGAIGSGQDVRQTELFQRSLRLGLISNPGSQDQESAAAPADSPTEELLLHVTGMWCTSCAWLIEHALKGVRGVDQAEVSFASDLIKVRYCPQVLPPERIQSHIRSLGYKAERYSDSTDAADQQRRDLLIRTGLASFLWANIMSFSLVLYASYFEKISDSVRRGLPFLLMILATPAVFYCAQPILRLAGRGLMNRAIRMEVLLALGILTAYGFSVVQAFRGETHLYFDTATAIVTLVLAGKLIERSAKEKASQWISQLHRMMPNKVRLLAQGFDRFVSVDVLEPGTIFVVKAGERIPADGLAIEGESYADESLLTGESRPVKKTRGQPVAAGSINLDGVLHVQAMRSANDSTLSRIIALVEHALSSRTELERVVDRVSRVFVPSVIVIAALTFLFGCTLSAASIGQALMRAITVLVIACPCALGLATPLAITAAFGAASRLGILVCDGRVLETVRKVDTIILDKTGTVTEGKFSLLELVPCHQLCPDAICVGVDANSPGAATSQMLFDSAEPSREALSLLASLEQYSEHPLATASVEFARGKGGRIYDATSVGIHKGRGITGIANGKHVFVGNRRLIKELGLETGESEDSARIWESEGKTVSFIGWDGELHAIAAFGDKVKPEARSLVADLRRRNIQVHLVSGDARATTQWVASCLGIDSCRSEVLPQDKAEVVKCLQERGMVVAMVGDGINDAPALAQADLGIALGSGTDIAMKAAAVVLMNNSLQKILDVFDLSRRTMRIVRQNLFWAFLYNCIGIPLAVAGILNPIMAAGAMLLSSLSVAGNSLRLARRVV